MKSLMLMLVLNLALGLSGYLTLSSFQDSLKQALRENAKGYLAGDVAISVRRQFLPNEIEAMPRFVPAHSQSSRMYEFFSMVAVGSDSRLVQIKAVDAAYPLYGELVLGSGRRIDSAASKEINESPEVWVYPEILTQLGLQVGDEMELGAQKFRITDTVVEDSTQTFRLASLAPKLYAGRSQIEKTNLIQFGTTMTDAVAWKFPAPGLSADEMKALGKRYLDEVKDPAVQWTTYLEASEDTGRLMGFLFDYLGLGALVGVSLAGFGLAALVRSWLGQKVRGYAIYNALGLQAGSIRRIFIFQLVILSTLTTLVSLTLVGFGLPFVANILRQWVTVDVDVRLTEWTLLKGYLLIVFGSIGVTLPFIRQMQEVPTQRLFAETSNFQTHFNLSWAVYWIPVLLGFWFLCLREANSYVLGSIFFAALIFSYGILALVGWLLFRFMAKSAQVKLWWLRQGFLYLGRKPALLTTFVALSLGSLLTTLIPQIRAGLYEEIAGNRSAVRPSIFLFDIQDDQLEGVKKIAESQGHELRNPSPLIRSRVLEVNGQAYERKESDSVFKTREEEDEIRFRNRGVNLSYRPHLTASEKLLEGRDFSEAPRPGKPAELSVEKRYAGRMGFKIGDVVKFDVQGVEFEGEVINLREVKWNSFQPNFFVLVQPGTLDEAPKNWLADLPALNLEQRREFQTALARQYPNISAIDVERTLEKALEVMDQMVFALQLMAVLTWVSGFFVLLSILYRQISLQEWDATLFRLLGASSGSVFKVFQVEFGVLVLAASFFGGLLALVIASALSYRFFDGVFIVDPWSLALTLGATMLIACSLTLFFSWRLARSNPARVLQSIRL